ncbi:hypothetical protein AB0B31_21625 [Catellatospora citrea]|uniref:hypothetical protein n=1 Tax=Catellatospora citrea TaxID=53366 RepID=UPI00340EEF8D
MTQQLFDEVIGEVPAPAVDVDRIVRRERRGMVARRLAGVSTGALAVLTVGALALGSGLGPRGAADPVAVPVTSGEPAVTDGPSAREFQLAYGTPAEAEATARRLSEELDRALLAVAPDRKWLYFPVQPGGPRQPDGQPLEVRFIAKRDLNGGELTLFAGQSGIETGGRKGALTLSITPTSAGGPRQPVQTQRDEPKPGLDYLYHSVTIPLADGNSLRLTSHNRSLTRDLEPEFQADPPLTVAQLQAIAKEVAMVVRA